MILLTGAVAGAVLIVFGRHRGPRVERRIYALGLVVASLNYVLLAVFGGDVSVRWLTIESLGVVPFATFAWLGLRRSERWLATGWAAHAIWDIGLHWLGRTPTFVPDSYPELCLSFDVVVTAAIVLLDRRVRGARGGSVEIDLIEVRTK